MGAGWPASLKPRGDQTPASPSSAAKVTRPRAISPAKPKMMRVVRKTPPPPRCPISRAAQDRVPARVPFERRRIKRLAPACHGEGLTPDHHAVGRVAMLPAFPLERRRVVLFQRVADAQMADKDPIRRHVENFGHAARIEDRHPTDA